MRDAPRVPLRLVTYGDPHPRLGGGGDVGTSTGSGLDGALRLRLRLRRLLRLLRRLLRPGALLALPPLDICFARARVIGLSSSLLSPYSLSLSS